uniref:Uncharacterized protein n=1 Tax=Anguilla anguilla TaxID=7936 RepID=A0A0E9UHF1_ANGAN
MVIWNPHVIAHSSSSLNLYVTFPLIQSPSLLWRGDFPQAPPMLLCHSSGVTPINKHLWSGGTSQQPKTLSAIFGN